jgi:hypothetical protein
MKKFAGVVALAAGFAVTALQPSPTLAELCGGKESSGCTGGSTVGNGGDHDGSTFSPPSS